MSSVFEAASSFNQDIAGWNTASVVDMSRMFAGPSSFNQDVSGWDVRNVQNFSGMFAAPSAFDQDLCKWAENLNAVLDVPFASNKCDSSQGSVASVPLIAGGAVGGFVALMALLVALLSLHRRNESRNKLPGELLRKVNFSGFLSHYKAEGGPSASLVKVHMEKELNGAVPFLDVDDLDDRATLLDKS